MRVALEDLSLTHLYVVYLGSHRFPAHERITMWPASTLSELPEQIANLG